MHPSDALQIEPKAQPPLDRRSKLEQARELPPALAPSEQDRPNCRVDKPKMVASPIVGKEFMAGSHPGYWAGLSGRDKPESCSTSALLTLSIAYQEPRYACGSLEPDPKTRD